MRNLKAGMQKNGNEKIFIFFNEISVRLQSDKIPIRLYGKEEKSNQCVQGGYRSQVKKAP